MSDAIDHLLEQVTGIALERPLPEATYRLQFHAGFTFRAALAVVPYLRDLGISHCYASPYLKARPGSEHGYDIVDHDALNPEIGSDADYDNWTTALENHGLAQLLDTVPNHMGISKENAWWNDVLENGPSSPYAGFFDIAWYASPRPELLGCVLLPFLGESYGEALESGRLKLEYDAGTFRVAYFEHRFPVDPRTYGLILVPLLEEMTKQLGPDSPVVVEVQSIATAVAHLPPRTEPDPALIAEGMREKEVVKRRLITLTAEIPAFGPLVNLVLERFNGTAGTCHSFDLMDGLLDAQAYRLSFWRVASDEINYRRFFDVNDLAAINMERPEVFAAAHSRIMRLLEDGTATGLRIDHPDGLYDPAEYLARLQKEYLFVLARRFIETHAEYKDLQADDVLKQVRQRIDAWMMARTDGAAHWPLYVVVEKILGAGEYLPDNWAAAGTTGYEFLNAVNGLFVHVENADKLTRIYEEWTDDRTPFAELAYQKKFLILQIALSSELHMLAYQLDRLAQKDRWSRDFTLNGLRHALREIIACFPVYRSYITAEGIRDEDRRNLLQAVRRAKRRNPALSDALFDFVRDTLLLKEARADTAGPEYRGEQLRFAGKFQQVTSPVVAKGVEDTAFYIYNRLLSLNEVGGDPTRFGLAPAALHRQLQERQARTPRALSTTATHDTKRGEDARARLNVLSELAGEWREAANNWHHVNQQQRIEVDEVLVPDVNEEYFLYQTLVGAWPLEPSAPDTQAQFVQRVQDYLVKALHEAKVNTSWINPNPAYDDAARQFVARILDPQTGAEFLSNFRPFQQRISHYGLFNSLAQTLLKLAAPGVPDIYQGTELWDYSFVDPDNRRPVDYEVRHRQLTDLQARVRTAGKHLRDLTEELVATRTDGRIKLYIIWRLLTCRRDFPGLFTEGAYVPLDADGPQRDHVFAFQRSLQDRHVLVVVPRLLTQLAPNPPQLPMGGEVWSDTTLLLPASSPRRRWLNLFTGETLTSAVRADQASLSLAEVLASFPVALLAAQP